MSTSLPLSLSPIFYNMNNIATKLGSAITYDHIRERIRDPVRSPLVKLVRGRLVVRSVTTGEYRLLYVFASFWPFHLFSLATIW